jgi:hypothetical protein
MEARDIHATARVGLTLKRMYENPEMPAYLMRPLRFLTDPTIPKGKLYTVAALIEQGLDDDAIRELTNTTRASLKKGREAIADGKTQESFEPWMASASTYTASSDFEVSRQRPWRMLPLPEVLALIFAGSQ